MAHADLPHASSGPGTLERPGALERPLWLDRIRLSYLAAYLGTVGAVVLVAAVTGTVVRARRSRRCGDAGASESGLVTPASE